MKDYISTESYPFMIRCGFNDFDLFIQESLHHHVIVTMARTGYITIKEYGIYLTLLWSKDMECNDLGRTIIDSLEKEYCGKHYNGLGSYVRVENGAYKL